MQTIIYDGSFEGWLTAVFDMYEYRWATAEILPEGQRQDNIFGDSHVAITDEMKAQRVWKGLRSKVSARASGQLYATFLSGQKGLETKMLQYVQYVFASKYTIEQDYSHPAVLYVNEMAKKVHREKHRMEAFVRFQKTKDDLYFAIVQPDFNVLPLIKNHFEKRYADQRWLIYDGFRKYGIYYDLQKVETIEIDFGESVNYGKVLAEILDEKEIIYQQMWQHYFKSVNIAARKNLKLHIRHMPLRYWKYLTEKNVVFKKL